MNKIEEKQTSFALLKKNKTCEVQRKHLMCLVIWKIRFLKFAYSLLSNLKGWRLEGIIWQKRTSQVRGSWLQRLEIQLPEQSPCWISKVTNSIQNARSALSVRWKSRKTLGLKQEESTWACTRTWAVLICCCRATFCPHNKLLYGLILQKLKRSSSI
jgi:hypothetical protein